MRKIKEALEYLGGARDLPPEGQGPALDSLFWGVWWFLMLVVILHYSGQSSKFIYIDF
ncbi:MAG TPA: hypothetical protein VGH19_04110 [Verrucomicrobiae bacterium]